MFEGSCRRFLRATIASIISTGPGGILLPFAGGADYNGEDECY
jgi:hypothetical protein